MRPSIHADVTRLTIAVRDRTSVMVLPSRLPLAEILPAVVTHLGVLDAYEAHAGYALLDSGGAALDLEASLLAQGVQEGAVLTVASGVGAPRPKVYDDVAEAVADCVDALDGGWTTRWTSSHSRLSALAIATLLCLVGAVALGRQSAGSSVVTVVAVLGSGVLLATGLVLARSRRDVGAAVPVLVGSGLYAVVAATIGLTGFSWPMRLGALGASVGGTMKLGALGASVVGALLLGAGLVLRRRR